MVGIQNLFKETIAKFMENILDEELDDELGCKYGCRSKGHRQQPKWLPRTPFRTAGIREIPEHCSVLAGELGQPEHLLAHKNASDSFLRLRRCSFIFFYTISSHTAFENATGSSTGMPSISSACV